MPVSTRTTSRDGSEVAGLTNEPAQDVPTEMSRDDHFTVEASGVPDPRSEISHIAAGESNSSSMAALHDQRLNRLEKMFETLLTTIQLNHLSAAEVSQPTLVNRDESSHQDRNTVFHSASGSAVPEPTFRLQVQSGEQLLNQGTTISGRNTCDVGPPTQPDTYPIGPTTSNPGPPSPRRVPVDPDARASHHPSHVRLGPSSSVHSSPRRAPLGSDTPSPEPRDFDESPHEPRRSEPLSSTRLNRGMMPPYGEVPFRHQVPINQINPPSFNGDRTTARQWLQDYESIMEINGYADDQKLKRARAYLTGDALNFFKVTLNDDPELDWWTFSSQFLGYFCGVDGKSQIRKKLENCKQQDKEHPNVFMMRTLELCLQLDKHLEEQQKVKYIARGLKRPIKNILVTSRPVSQWTTKWLRSVFDEMEFEVEPPKSSERPAKTEKSQPKQSRPPKNLDTWVCFNCGKTGHIIEDCKEPKDEAKIKSLRDSHRAERARKAERNDQPNTERNANEASRTSQIRHLPCDDFTKPTAKIRINGSEVAGLVDGGAEMTIIPAKVASKLNLQLQPWDQPAFASASGNPITMLGMCPVLAEYNGVRKPLLIAVAETQHTLFGNDLLHVFNISITYSNNNVSIETLAEAEVGPDSQDRLANSLACATTEHPADKIQFGEVDSEVRDKIATTLSKYPSTFSRDELDIGRTGTVKHRIFLTDDRPVHKPPYRVPFRSRPLMEEAINKMVKTGALRQSSSPYASPVFFVDKDHGAGKRLVADFRALNAKTIPDRTPMPHPEDVFGLLSGMNIFAKLDITSMFNQIEVDPRDVEKTAVSTPFGLFECPLMPFGLVNAPATAVKLMKEVLKDIDGKAAYVYFDDIIVFASDIDQLLVRCEEVLKRLEHHNLKLKPSKCIFGVRSVQFLGHTISAEGVSIDPRRITDVKNFPTPRNPSEVRSFHGLCSYNRKFIRGFADIAKPLTPLMGKPDDFTWSIEAQQAFERLRDALISAPTLVHFDPDADHELRTDASAFAMGAVLYQKHELPDRTGVVLYFSKTLNAAQRNYSATERELLAAFTSIMELKHYLIGKKFTLVTDHAALSLLKNQKDPHHRLARWVAQLQAFDFDVLYKSGSTHVDADCMSRLVKDTSVEVDSEKVDEETFRSIYLAAQPEPCLSQTPSEEAEDLIPAIDIRKEQREDPFCKKYIGILESATLTPREKSRQARNFTIQDGQLYRMRHGDILTLVVPQARRNAVLLSCHEVPLAGHLGFSRTYGIAKVRYFWPKMRRDIKKHVASCINCQRRKVSTTRKQGLINPLPVAEEVFGTVGIDLIVKLPTSHGGYNTILVCTDNLSKYVVTVALKNERSETIIHAFYNHFIAKFGSPHTVISDRGSNLIGKVASDFFRLMGIRRKLTSPLHPQSNGQTERFNRTLAVAMTSYVERTQRDWPDFLQAITFAYNMTEHSVTKVAPHEVVFGKKPRIPIDNLLERNDFVDPQAPQSNRIQDSAFTKIREYIKRVQDANKRRLDAKLDATTFNEGDLVLVERPVQVKGAAHKLSYTYVGPYTITKRHSDLTLEISPTNDPTKSSIIHPSHLRLHIPRTEVVEDDLVDPTFVPREPIEESPTSELSDTETEHAEEIDIFDHPPSLSPPHDTSNQTPEFDPLTDIPPPLTPCPEPRDDQSDPEVPSGSPPSLSPIYD